MPSTPRCAQPCDPLLHAPSCLRPRHRLALWQLCGALSIICFQLRRQATPLRRSHSAKVCYHFLPLLQQLRAHKQINTASQRCGKQQSRELETNRKPATRLDSTRLGTHIMDVDASSSFIIMQNVLPSWLAFSSNSSSSLLTFLSLSFLSSPLSHYLCTSPSPFAYPYR